MVSGYSIPPIATALAMFSLGLFVLSRNIQSGVHRALFLQCLCHSVWLFTYGIMYSVDSAEVARSIVNIGYTAVIFIPVTFYHFIIHFLKIYSHKRWLVLSYITALGFAGTLWFSPYFVTEMTRYFWGFYHQEIGRASCRERV